VADMSKIVGTTTDQEDFDKTKADRWVELNPHLFHCKIHDTHFDPVGYEENDFQDSEPCWVCWNEFQRKL
jgi:hypothetical protein